MEQFLPYKIRQNVELWRINKYECAYPVISEIFEYAFTETENDTKDLRYLRRAQFEALETYWYIRIVENSPKIIDLYNKYYPDKNQLFEALGISLEQKDLIKLLNGGWLDTLRQDDEFIKRNRLEALRETITLDYPSYILALAMGAGKTALIGAVIATEFAMALEYGNGQFIRNALVFAPGKTILGALKEISDIPYEKILPPRLYKQFISSIKVTYTQDKEKDIPINRGSNYNIIITNTEKIRIQKPTAKANNQLTLLNYKEKEKLESQTEVANLRLQSIASLPGLGIFSDEAHHTYGQSLSEELKKVRKTVDYLAQNTNVLAVVNTTGTPYFKKQMLKDVVFWYGLSQGIKDGILKEVKDNIIAYEDIDDENFVKQVVENFFKDYGKVEIFDGAKAKLAIYFPQTDDIDKFKPAIQAKVIELGYDPSIVIDINNKSEDKLKDFFNNRINEPHNPYRVYLLVNMGTEGWNCLSLFATALARKLVSSNNFVLQAASRCLRQVPNNTVKARIYLSHENVRVLDSQLKETFGESLQLLNKTSQDMRKDRIVLRKIEIPTIVINKKIKTVVAKTQKTKPLELTKPEVKQESAKRVSYDVKDPKERFHVLTKKSVEEIYLNPENEDTYQVATGLAAIYRLDVFKLNELLKTIYLDGEIPENHIIELKKQLESQLAGYEITEETVEIALALIKKEGFDREIVEGNIVYVSEIMYHKNNENLLIRYDKLKNTNQRDFSFHYTPYKMDSNPEKEFFLDMLEALNENPDDIEDIYFTGAITDHNKTDFIFEYKDKHGIWRNYTPDFVLRKKDGRVVIVEIKAEVYKDENKEMAIREIAGLNPDKLKYEILMTDKDNLKYGELDKIKRWVYGENR